MLRSICSGFANGDTNGREGQGATECWPSGPNKLRSRKGKGREDGKVNTIESRRMGWIISSYKSEESPRHYSVVRRRRVVGSSPVSR